MPLVALTTTSAPAAASAKVATPIPLCAACHSAKGAPPVAPGSVRASVACGSRVPMTTSCPRPDSAAAIVGPTVPVPSTAIFMASSVLDRLERTGSAGVDKTLSDRPVYATDLLGQCRTARSCHPARQTCLVPWSHDVASSHWKAAARTPAGQARDKILATAFRLFYAQGLRAAGIDTIIAESGVAKATFYKYFPAKDDLILAYLEKVDGVWTGQLHAAAEAAGPDPAAQLVGLFDALASACRRDGYRGCAFINAAAESASGTRVHERTVAHKEHVRAWIRGLAEEAGAPDPDRLARSLTLVLDGGLASGVLDADPAAAIAARRHRSPTCGREPRHSTDSQLTGSRGRFGASKRPLLPATSTDASGGTREHHHTAISTPSSPAGSASGTAATRPWPATTAG